MTEFTDWFPLQCYADTLISVLFIQIILSFTAIALEDFDLWSTNLLDSSFQRYFLTLWFGTLRDQFVGLCL